MCICSEEPKPNGESNSLGDSAQQEQPLQPTEQQQIPQVWCVEILTFEMLYRYILISFYILKRYISFKIKIWTTHTFITV